MLKYKSLLVGTVMSLVLSQANAAVDVAATVTSIGEAAAAVLLVGAAVIAVKVGVKLYKWASASL